jgi:NADPH-dependent curcumin reductase CurA
MTINHQFRLAARPVGLPQRTDWSSTEEQVGEPAADTFVVKILYISLDPAMRGWMNASRSYIPPVAIGAVMRALAIGRVTASRHPGFDVGDDVSGPFGVQEYALSDGKGVTKVDRGLAPLPMHLSVLGMTGKTAYFGLLEVGQPKPGETVVVSAAAGAVGSVVGQIARIMGCRAVGIAGGAEKCRYLVDELGFDAAIDYKAGDVRAALKEHCPDGIDVYFDNVGGEILEAALSRLARGARIVICGAISQYCATGPQRGPSNYMALLVHRASMRGFLVGDYHARNDEATRALATWVAEGKLKSREHIVDGLETFPDTLNALFTGENLGKLLIKIAGD